MFHWTDNILQNIPHIHNYYEYVWLCILAPFDMGDINPPLTNLHGEVDRGRGSWPAIWHLHACIPTKQIKNVQVLTENCCVLRPSSKNKNGLAFLKATCPYNPHRMHFIFNV